jgi:Raf kinase inhibitor-like YbhB/YbcL family protein
MELTTADFGPGQAIPKAFTADGADISPALSWRGVPQGTGALALVMEDPDAPVGLWTHWVVYDLPPTLDGLPQDQPRDPALAGGGKQGVNSWSRLGWNGPSPPPGKPHRYVFRLFALSSPL